MYSASIVVRFFYFSMKLGFSTKVTSARTVEGQSATRGIAVNSPSRLFFTVPSLRKNELESYAGNVLRLVPVG